MAANAPASLTISSVSRIWLRNSIMGVGAHRDHCGEDQCRNMRHCRLRRFELRCAKGPGPLGAPLDEGACERQAIQPPQRRLFSWEAQGSAPACANPNLCDLSKRRIFTFHIEVRIRYAQPRSRSLRWDFPAWVLLRTRAGIGFGTRGDLGPRRGVRWLSCRSADLLLCHE